MKQNTDNELLLYEGFADYYNYIFNFSKNCDFDTKHYFSLSSQKSLEYINQNLNFDSFELNTELSIDFVKLFYSYNPIPSSSARKLIRAHSSKIKKVKASGNVIYTFMSFNDKIYELCFSFIFIKNYYKGFSVKISHPDKDIIRIIEGVFGKNYTISAVEYSADLYSNDPKKLLKVIASTIMQRYSRQGIGRSYPTTYYCSNPRKATSLGTRAYYKEINSEKFVRIECLHKRKLFRDKKINSIMNAVGLPPKTVFDRIEFRFLNLRRFLKKYLKEANNNPNIKNRNLSEKELALEFQTEFFRCLSSPKGGGFLFIKEYLSQIVDNPMYYFDKYPFKEYFLSSMEGKNFID